jgi:hypothetical protein
MAAFARDADIVPVDHVAEINSLLMPRKHQPQDHVLSHVAKNHESRQKDGKRERDIYSIS